MRKITKIEAKEIIEKLVNSRKVSEKDIKKSLKNNERICVKEILKYEYSKTHFHIKGKEDSFNEWWYYDIEVEAKTRDEAISKVFNSGDFGLTKHDCSFIEFKKKVTCVRVKTLVFDKWKELNTI